VELPVPVSMAVEPPAPALEPELIVPELEPEPAVEPVPAAPELAAPEPVVPEAEEPAVEPCAAAPVPPGVPVEPIGVFWELRWPAPVAGSLDDDDGGVLCANARLTVAAAATAARILSEDIFRTP